MGRAVRCLAAVGLGWASLQAARAVAQEPGVAPALQPVPDYRLQQPFSPPEDAPAVGDGRRLFIEESFADFGLRVAEGALEVGFGFGVVGGLLLGGIGGGTGGNSSDLRLGIAVMVVSGALGLGLLLVGPWINARLVRLIGTAKGWRPQLGPLLLVTYVTNLVVDFAAVGFGSSLGVWVGLAVYLGGSAAGSTLMGLVASVSQERFSDTVVPKPAPVPAPAAVAVPWESSDRGPSVPVGGAPGLQIAF